MKTNTALILMVAISINLILPVSAIYQPSEEQNAISDANKMVEEYGGNNSLDNGFVAIYDMISAIYQSSEHNNELLEKQNDLTTEEIHVMWVQTCYTKHSDYGMYGQIGNDSALNNECKMAGYPTVVSS